MGNICVRPKCNYRGCKSRKTGSLSRLCNHHECAFHDCNLVIRDGSKFCDKHTCNYQSCKTRVKVGFFKLGDSNCDDNYFTYLYCIVHNCQNPHCTGFKKAETKFCLHCCSMMKINHSHHHGITNTITCEPCVVEENNECDCDEDYNKDDCCKCDNLVLEVDEVDGDKEDKEENNNEGNKECECKDSNNEDDNQCPVVVNSDKTQPCQPAEKKTEVSNYVHADVASTHPNTFNKQNVVIEVDGVGCRDCHHLKNCQKCVRTCGSVNSSELIDCKNCFNSKKCKDSTNLMNSENCLNSHNCVGCYNCVDCC